MPTLLVSLGTSPAVVPEAFLLPGVEFTAVHVLTSQSVPVDFVMEWFSDHAPDVALTVTRVAGFSDFRSEEDHFRFEEVLYRWWLEKSEAAEHPHVCLTGGFKTMSAAMQKAAAVMGAAEVFHVLCDLPPQQQPRTAEEIETARAGGNLHWIRLGPEAGWPQLSQLTASGYPLQSVRDEGIVKTVAAPDSGFRDHLRQIVERSHNIAGAWSRIPSLPFPALATWSAEDLAWLDAPLDGTDDRAWIEAIPKVELHCHLGGFATHGELLGEVRAHAEKPADLPALPEPTPPAGWPRPAQTTALDDYMRLGDANGSRLLKDPGCLRRQIELLYDHLCAQNIVYAEVRCSPNNYSSDTRSAWAVLSEIRETFQQCMVRDGAGCHVNLLIIATRKGGGDRSDISRHLSLAITAAQHWAKQGECRVVGVDLAGFENRETRAALFATDFEPAHRVGLAVTVHAGENDDAEGIWQAVFKLSTLRIGHALHLVDAPDLMRSVADRRIGVEMCPYANYQIKGFDPMPGKPAYPLKRYLDAGVSVTVNTDNIGISAASLTDNFLLLAELCPGITRLEVLRLVRNAMDQSFLSPHQRSMLLGRQIPFPS